MCAPSLWFDELKNVEQLEIFGFRSADNRHAKAREAWRAALADANVIIVGGGGLLEIDFFCKALEYVSQNRKSRSKLVLWGAGHNNWKIEDWRKLKQSVSIDQYNFDLVGIRDFDHGYRWVPCSSCMAPIFDQIPPPTEEVVMYAHAATLANQNLKKTLPTGMPVLNNSATFEEAIRFLASGDLILTDSFHGMYWATLLGRRVIAFPSSSKFYSARHATPLCDPSDWRRFEPLARKYPDALDECRYENRKFADEVLQWF